MMKKIIIGIFITIASILIIYGFATWYVGSLFKDNFFNLVNIVNRDHRVKIDVLAYHQYWLKSNATIRITAVGLNSNNQTPVSIIVESHIAHGPIVFDKLHRHLTLACASIKSSIHLEEQATPESLSKTNLEVRLNTLATFNNEWLNQIQIPALAWSMQNGDKLTWEGLKGFFNLTVNRNAISAVKIKLNIGSLFVQLENDQINLQSANYENNIKRQANGLWEGSSRIITPHLFIKIANGASVAVDDLNASNQFGMNANKNYDLSFHLAANMVQVSTMTFMPVVSPVNVSFTLTDLNAKSVNEFSNFAKAMRSKQFSNADKQAFLVLLPHLITPSSTVNENMMIGTSLGVVQADIKLYWPATMQLPVVFSEVVRDANVKANFKIAIPLFVKLLNTYLENRYTKSTPATFIVPSPQLITEMSNQLIDSWLKKGYILQQGNDYVTTMTDEEGVVKLNDHVLSQSSPPAIIH